MNLNYIGLRHYDYGIDENYGEVDYSTKSNDIKVYFRDLKGNLIKHIKESKIVIGCVAWLTDFDILDILADKDVFIVIQKEDFLRPDINARNINSWKNKLQQKYNNLKPNDIVHGCQFNNDLQYVSTSSIYDSAVRCVGNYNTDKKPAFPRMHNKFIITCEYKHQKNCGPYVIPKGVWTGSFNFTYNATQSFENALYITDKTIVKAYYNEFGHIASLSEELHWENDWINPEWRIGT